MRNIAIIKSISTITPTTGSIFSPPPAMVIQHQSAVVPYLFGGLAAMLGLIALALLILACSYLKNSGNSERDPEAAGDEKLENSGMPIPVLKDAIVVIMAGDVKPTFLATPISGRDSCSVGGQREKEQKEKDDECEKPKENEDTQDQRSS